MCDYCLRQYRRECLRALELPYEDEFEFVDEFAEDNPKNYQIWYHRRAIVESSGKFGMEKMFTQTVLEIDAKNYHAWAHRYLDLKNSFTGNFLIIFDYCCEQAMGY